MRKVGDLDLERMLIASCHEAVIKVAQTALCICGFYFLAYNGGAGNDYLIAAAHPEERLDHSFDESEIHVVLTDAVFINTGFVCGNVAVITNDADHDILSVFLCCLAHFADDKAHRLKLLVKNRFYLKLHSVPYLRLWLCLH